MDERGQSLNYIKKNVVFTPDTSKPVHEWRCGATGACASYSRVLYDKYGARYEGFASPLNSKLMGKPNAHFCSLFKDTDEPFGSIGRFAVKNIINPKNKGNWSVNVPYVLSIIKDASHIIIESLVNPSLSAIGP